MSYLLTVLWAARSAKAELFWLYLLQVKEYKLKRFIDHFRTEKGKRLLLDPINLSKIGLVLLSPITYSFLWIVISGIYAVEFGILLKNLLGGGIKKPIITSKSAPLIGIFLTIEVIFGIWAFINSDSLNDLALYLATFDILIPVISLLIIAPLKPLNRILRKKIINAAKAKRADLKNLLVIGITGSFGKTSTKEFLYEILKNKFNVIRTPEHVNTEIGASHFILDKLTQKHEIFICEMGAYEKGEVKETADIVKPQIGVFLGANEQHLSLFGSMRNLLRAEGGEELLEELEKNHKSGQIDAGKSLGIFNGNNIYAYELWKRAHIPKRITYVPNLLEIINPEKRDVRAENIRVEKEHVSFKVLTNKNSKGVDFKLNLLGAHNIENVLLSVALAEMLGLSLEEIKTAAKDIKPLPRTLTLIENKNGVSVVNSTYSSNPSAVEAHLEYLKAWNKKKKIVIMPCLIELGSASQKIHTQIGRSLALNADLAIITTKDRFSNIINGATLALGEAAAKEKIIFSENQAEIIQKLKDTATKGDVILLEGRLPDKLIKGIEN